MVVGSPFESWEVTLKTNTLIHLSLLVIALLPSACASAPTWEGMSETEISAWKELNAGPGDAQTYREAGLDVQAVSQWSEHGFKKTDAVLAWHKAGFTAAEAKAWRAKRFTWERAVAWREEKFKPEEAYEWKKGGFNLEDSVENRERGLKPIQPVAPKKASKPAKPGG